MTSKNFIENTLRNITSGLEENIFSERNASKNGFLQKVAPEIKILFTFLILILISSANSHIILLSVYSAALPLVYFSQIPFFYFLKRVWILMPFFTGVIAIPVLFNIFSPGRALITFINLSNPHIYLSITDAGVYTSTLLILRVGCSLTLTLLLILTTKWNTILRTLKHFHFPTTFILILAMTYRYIFLLITFTDNLLLSRKSRIMRELTSSENHRILSSAIGVLLSKSFFLSSDIYLAMKSRGFNNRYE